MKIYAVEDYAHEFAGIIYGLGCRAEEYQYRVEKNQRDAAEDDRMYKTEHEDVVDNICRTFEIFLTEEY